MNSIRPDNVLKILIFVLVAIGVLASLVEAVAGDYEIAGGGGMSVNALQPVHATQGMLLGAWIIKLGRYFDLRIEPNVEFIAATSGESMFLGGVSPVLRLRTRGHTLNPFVDVGAGVSLGSRKAFEGWNMGSQFSFSPTGGGGIKFGKSESSVSIFARFIHHSNANLFPPNQSLNSVYFLMGYRF
jgi:hypothetical protein